MNVFESGRTIRNFTDADARQLAEAGAKPARGVQIQVGPEERIVIRHPSNRGFFTLDRALGAVPIVVTEYRIGPSDLRRTRSLEKVLTDWLSTPWPSTMREPNFDRFDLNVSRQGEPMTAAPGSAVSVVALQGKTPVSMVFVAR